MRASGGSTNGHSADIDIDTLYSFWPGHAPAPQPCPEALFSLTLKGTIGGHEALLTARGQSPEEFLRNLEAIRGLLDAVPAPAPASSPGEGWCSIHQVPLQRRENAKGVWFSHYVDGKHCKGR
jgi:hypothetical protein